MGFKEGIPLARPRKERRGFCMVGGVFGNGCIKATKSWPGIGTPLDVLIQTAKTTFPRPLSISLVADDSCDMSNFRQTNLFPNVVARALIYNHLPSYKPKLSSPWFLVQPFSASVNASSLTFFLASKRAPYFNSR